MAVNVVLFVQLMKRADGYRRRTGEYSSFPEEEGGGAGEGGAEQQYAPPEY